MERITGEERGILRELAKRQAEYAALDVMGRRTELWYAHNSLRDRTPPIVVEEGTFESEILPPARCRSPFAQELERTMQRFLVNHELVDDDKVVPSYLPLALVIDRREFGVGLTTHGVKDSVAYQYDHLLHSISGDFHKLRPSTYHCDRALNRERLETAQELLGDLLPVHVENHSLNWYMTLTLKAVALLGLENLMLEMAEEPEEVERLMTFLTQDVERFLDWQEAENLLTANSGNHYVGSGSFGFTRELDTEAPRLTTRSLWGNMNSQESSCISPAMYRELVYPYYEKLAGRFGHIYYGCCEPVHAIWKDCLENLPNLRKVSISPWCDEAVMGEALRGRDIIYSRKPSPNFIGVGRELDEPAFREHIRKTLRCAQGCVIEFIFRDIYTLGGDLQKPGRAVKIVRELIEESW